MVFHKFSFDLMFWGILTRYYCELWVHSLGTSWSIRMLLIWTRCKGQSHSAMSPCSSAVVILEPYPSSKQQLWNGDWYGELWTDSMERDNNNSHQAFFPSRLCNIGNYTNTWITDILQCSGVHNLTCLRLKISRSPISAHCRLVEDMTRIMTF